MCEIEIRGVKRIKTPGEDSSEEDYDYEYDYDYEDDYEDTGTGIWSESYVHCHVTIDINHMINFNF